MIKYAPIDLNKLRNLIVDIQNNITELYKLADLTLADFKSDSKNYGLAEHYLRRSLEGILTIGTHILSRLPVKMRDYSDIIVSLGEQKIIPKDFAEKNKGIAVYRNRLVHMYWEISKDEMHQILNEHLKDIDKFCDYFQKVLQEPERFGLIKE